jgi:hypothetical protein
MCELLDDLLLLLQDDDLCELVPGGASSPYGVTDTGSHVVGVCEKTRAGAP